MASDAETPRRSRRGSGAVTLHDVAKLAGVAPITASRAVNTPEQVSEEVRRKVSAAIARTGYVPNRLAGSLASTRSRLVAALVPTITGPIFSATVQALTDALAERGYQLMLGQSGYGGNREDALLEAIIGRRPDGIVLTGITHSDTARRQLVASSIPVVETWDLTPTPIDMLVGFSHSEVGRAVAEFFHRTGRRRLAVISGDDERAARRQQAFVETAARLGLPPVACRGVPAPTTLREGRAAMAELMAQRTGEGGVEAVFCSSDLLALGVLTEARSHGLSVPQQLGVVGFGDLEIAADLRPALTTVRIDAGAVGRHAAQFIVDRAESRVVDPRVIDIGFSIVERETT